MPVKNTAPYLQECLDSILNQTYQAWELIAVNDHSTDSSALILAEYQTQDERIKVYENEGSGIVAALQLAYSKSKGGMLTRMDSDDINSLDKYEIMQQQLDQSGEGFIALGLVNYFSAQGVQDGFKKYENWLNGLLQNGNSFLEIYKECGIPSPCWLAYKTDIEKIGGVATSLIPEDYDLAFRMYQADMKCIPTKEVLLHWRDTPTRTSRTHSDYTNEKMLALKCHYFVEIDFESTKNLILWGAGRRGKFIAKYLIENKIRFTWVCNNEKKVGKSIYGVMLQNTNIIRQIEKKQIIISVANEVEQEEIRIECADWQAYFFC